jgi:hypothetical protein
VLRTPIVQAAVACPAALDAVTVRLQVPVLVGVPEMTPVVAAGSAESGAGLVMTGTVPV